MAVNRAETEPNPRPDGRSFIGFRCDVETKTLVESVAAAQGVTVSALLDAFCQEADLLVRFVQIGRELTAGRRELRALRRADVRNSLDNPGE